MEIDDGIHQHSRVLESSLVNSEMSGISLSDSKLFYQKLDEFHQVHGLSLAGGLAGTILDLFLLYREVLIRGGFNLVTKYERWAEVASVLNFTSEVGVPSVQLQDLYESLLYHFELSYCTGIRRKLNEPSGPLFFPSNLDENTAKRKLSSTNDLPTGKKQRQAYPSEFPKGSEHHKPQVGNVKSVEMDTEFDISSYLVPDKDGPEELHQWDGSSAKHFANAPSLISFNGSDSNPVRMQNRGDPDGMPPRGSNSNKAKVGSKAGSPSIDTQKKDPNAPKRPRTGYQMFLAAECERLKKISGKSSSLNVQKAVEAWKRLTDRDRMPYNEKAKKARERFKKEMAAYEKRQMGQTGKTIPEREPEPEPSTSNAQTIEFSNAQLNGECNVSSTSDVQTSGPYYAQLNGEYYVPSTDNIQTASTSNAQLYSDCHVSLTSNIQTEETSHAQQFNDEYHVSLQLEEPDKFPEPDASMLEFAFKMMENAKKHDTSFPIDLGEFLSVP